MSFEAVPCMFQSTATDGNSASYIGLLIRPSNSATVSQAPTVIPAVVAPSISVQKASHVVPSTVLKIPYAQKPGKADLPSNVFRLQSTTCSTPHCESWIQKGSRPNVSNRFESQAIPQMNTAETYNTTACSSTSSFFPPIASIAQGFSSSKSSLESMPDCASFSTSSSQKSQSAYCDYLQNGTSNYRYNAITVADSRFPQLAADISSNHQAVSCKYQTNYNPANDCSATPDSGIQSIGDSPRSVGPFATPMSSPAGFIPAASTEINGSVKELSRFEDFSDMPRLVPYHQMEEPCCSTSDEAPYIVDATRSENEEVGHEETVPKIAITPSVNVNDLVEQLMSHLGPEQRKQFADAIKSKVVEEFDKNKAMSSTQVSPPTDGSVEEEAWDIASGNIIERKKISDEGQSQQCEISSYVREIPVEEKEEKNWTAEKIEDFSENSGILLFENGQQELCEEEISYICQSRVEGSEEETRKRKDDQNEELHGKFVDRRSFSESSAKERILELVFLESSDSSFHQNDEMPHSKEFSEGSNNCIDFKEEKLTGKRKSSLNHEKIQGKKVKLKDASNTLEIFSMANVVESAEKRRIPFRTRKSEEFVSSEDLSVGLEHVDGDSSFHYVKTNNELREDSKERLCRFRMKVKQQMNEQLNLVISHVEKQLSGLELQLGPRLHWELPWYRLNWKQVAQRIAERTHQEKLTKEKKTSAISCKSRLVKRRLKRSSLRNTATSLVSSSLVTASNSSFNSQLESYKPIKNNVIVDAYTRVELKTCSCRSGCCGETDQCLNRMIRMECTSSCPRGKYCSNRRISRREYVSGLEKFETSAGCGIGVRTPEAIQEGQFICEFVGEVVSDTSFSKRRKLYKNCKKCLAFKLGTGFVIDAYRKGNIARFINHSCFPNCEIQQWTVNGQLRLGIFALQNIGKGEELLFDHSFFALDFDDVRTCSIDKSDYGVGNLLMTNREKEIASQNRLLLLRNVEKSAKQRIVAAQSKKLEKERQKLKNAEQILVIRGYCDEILAVLTGFGSISKKHLASFQASVNLLFTQSSADNEKPLLKAVEIELQNLFDLIARYLEKKKLDALKAKVFAVKSSYAEPLKKYFALPQSFGEKPRTSKKRLHAHRILTATTDLSYLDCGVPVGSYDPDDTSDLSKAEADSDCVRCICGITDDDGSMVQCDNCHFWLHDDCVYFSDPSGGNEEFTCDFCKTAIKRTPPIDIPLRPQPDIKLAGCTYYRTLVNDRNIQVRLNETVYTQKLSNDDHKMELKRLSEAAKEQHSAPDIVSVVPFSSKTVEATFQMASFSRRDLRCFRVERLFMSPEGHKFVFGSHYARPHEVYCEPGRLFHKNELFATSMFDTLPLNAVVGRCLALEPRIYCLGRPKMPRYKEADVYFYEFQQTGRNSRYFEKISSRNHYYVNTGSHNFSYFSASLKLERNFTPFVLANPSLCRNTLACLNKSSNHTKESVIISRRNKKSKAARLENLVQKLAAQTS